MWRIPGERITLDLDGPAVEVERLCAWPVQYQCLRLLGAFYAATDPDAEYRALVPLFERFMYEAQPSWSIADHRGVIPCTAGGMVRLPITLALSMVAQWLESLEVPVAELPSAVDAVLPPGPLNLEVKRRLRRARKAA